MEKNMGKRKNKKYEELRGGVGKMKKNMGKVEKYGEMKKNMGE